MSDKEANLQLVKLKKYFLSQLKTDPQSAFDVDNTFSDLQNLLHYFQRRDTIPTGQ